MPPTRQEATAQEAEAQYSKAARAELAKEYDRAFRHYVKAAEQYLSLGRQTTDEQLRTLYRSQATKALERAEKIKAAKRDIRPVAKDAFSESEQLYVLQKSSMVNGSCFPLWDSPDQPSPSTEQPPLSAEHRRQGAIWTKPGDSRYTVTAGGESALEPVDIVQRVVSDCSVCGSVAVCVDHHRRFGSTLVLSAFYPQDDHRRPLRSDSGLYQFRILYNGSYRRISFDDQLPTHPDGTLMCMSTGDKAVLWPSLVEKAYMKLAGGYDFIGSDSSTDLHALTGWIPEHVDIRSSEFQAEKTWARLADGYRNGDCVLTLGTGERIPEGQLPIRLRPAHCYAVIGVCSDEHRRITVFDPWVRSSSDGAEPADGSAEQRLHEISWDEACSLFDGVYFSWNPKLFKHQLTFHGLWRREGAKGSDTSSHFRGQLQLEAGCIPAEEHSVWVQLTRHVRSHRSTAEYISLGVQSGSGVSSSFNRDILYTKGQYTNACHVLVRTSLSPGELLTFVASYEGEREDVGFTVTVYTNVKASWVPKYTAPMYSKDIEGAFTHKTAGGNHTYPTYFLNPQYHLRIHPRQGADQRNTRDAKADLSLSLRGDRQIPMNITLAWSRGERINELGHNDLAISSGPYSYGYALASGRVPPAEYTVVVSAFDPRHVGKFDLKVECSDNFEITPLPQEGAGMFSKVVRGEWTGQSAAGGPSFGNYAGNPAYELHVPTVGQLKFRLHLTWPTPAASLNLTIFPSSRGSASGVHIATSGPYSDAISGVVIPQTTFQPGRYLVVPSTYNPGIQAGFVLIAYSTISGVQLVPVPPR